MCENRQVASHCSWQSPSHKSPKWELSATFWLMQLFLCKTTLAAKGLGSHAGSFGTISKE